MVRRAIAAGAGIVVLLLLVFGVRGCLDARKERALKDYVRDVGALVQESDQESEALFELLRDPGDANEVDIENQLNTFRNQAEPARRPRGRHRPPRRRGRRARLPGRDVRVPPRRGGEHRRAAARTRSPTRATAAAAPRPIAAAMQNFLTSDVIYQTRFTPRLKTALKDARHRREGAREQLPARHRVAAAERGGRSRAQPRRHRRRRRRRARPARQRPRRRHPRRPGAQPRTARRACGWPTTSSS